MRRPVDFAGHGCEVERLIIHVLWLTSGLSCDGESVSLTAATSPSLEELLRGAIPGQPRIALYNPLLAYDVGDEYLEAWHAAARGELNPFVLVIEGSVANEEINGAGHWSGFGVDEEGQPITASTWIDWLAPRAAAVMALGTCAAYGGVPAMRNNPTGAMGLRDHLGRRFVSRRGRPLINLPGCPVQPDAITETLQRIASSSRASRRRPSSTSRAGRGGCSSRRLTRPAIAPGWPSKAASPRRSPTTPPASPRSAARARWPSAMSRRAAG